MRENIRNALLCDVSNIIIYDFLKCKVLSNINDLRYDIKAIFQ